MYQNATVSSLQSRGSRCVSGIMRVLFAVFMVCSQNSTKSAVDLGRFSGPDSRSHGAHGLLFRCSRCNSFKSLQVVQSHPGLRRFRALNRLLILSYRCSPTCTFCYLESLRSALIGARSFSARRLGECSSLRHDDSRPVSQGQRCAVFARPLKGRTTYLT